MITNLHLKNFTAFTDLAIDFSPRIMSRFSPPLDSLKEPWREVVMQVTDVRAVVAIGLRGQFGLRGHLPWEGNRGREYVAVSS